MVEDVDTKDVSFVSDDHQSENLHLIVAVLCSGKLARGRQSAHLLLQRQDDSITLAHFVVQLRLQLSDRSVALTDLGVELSLEIENHLVASTHRLAQLSLQRI